MNKFELPIQDIVDDIALVSLKKHYQMAKEEIDGVVYDGKWLNRDDIEYQSVLMFHLKAIIEYYGGSVE